MANTRRTSFHSHPQILPVSSSSQFSDQSHSNSLFVSLFNSLSLFLKRPRAFPILLSIFVLLTWLSLRYSTATTSSSSSSSFNNVNSKETLSSSIDFDANLVRLSASGKDDRGWMVDPVALALKNGILGGAQYCASIHAGEIRPGKIRGNHRHHTCNETFILWGADIKFRLENAKVEGKGYGEATVKADEVAVAASPAGTAHALINVDRVKSAFFIGCQDKVIDYNSSVNDYKVWSDLL